MYIHVLCSGEAITVKHILLEVEHDVWTWKLSVPSSTFLGTIFYPF